MHKIIKIWNKLSYDLSKLVDKHVVTRMSVFIIILLWPQINLFLLVLTIEAASICFLSYTINVFKAFIDNSFVFGSIDSFMLLFGCRRVCSSDMRRNCTQILQTLLFTIICTYFLTPSVDFRLFYLKSIFVH